MSFWAYMLHCRGGHFYVGHTDDLDRRIAEHQSGLIPGFTADHQPVAPVWAQGFPTREEAKAAERRIKGWSRAKKLALIRGDWARISALAKGKDSPSTSSGQSVPEGIRFGSSDPPELVEGPSFSLQPHPMTPPLRRRTIGVRCDVADGLARVRYVVTPGAGLVWPAPASGKRSDGLWKSTCFELFARGEGSGYVELNFSPSGAWAAYRFDDYREGSRNLAMQTPPDIAAIDSGDLYTLVASLDARLLNDARAMNFCAVIEERGGAKSYWALQHPDPAKPDFHDPACFTATLPAPRGA